MVIVAGLLSILAPLESVTLQYTFIPSQLAFLFDSVMEDTVCYLCAETASGRLISSQIDEGKIPLLDDIGFDPSKVQDSGETYEEGRDYAEIPKAKGVWPGPWNRYRFAVKPLPGGQLREGDEIAVDCYCSFPTWGKWASACMAAPELDPIMEASAAAVARELNPRIWFLSYDEVRTGGGCTDCRRIGDMAHIYAACVKRSMAIIRRHRPDAEIMIWNDMVDPFYMNDGGANAGMYSSMKGVWDLLPPDLGIGYWTYGTREKGMAFFSGQGRHLLVCAYYDEKVLKRSLDWADLAVRTPGVIGIVYCTWGENWELLGAFGDMVRRKAKAD